MLISLVYLLQENIKKSKKLMKIFSIDEGKLHNFRTTWGFSMKYSGKMCESYDIIKNHKKQALPPL